MTELTTNNALPYSFVDTQCGGFEEVAGGLAGFSLNRTSLLY